MQRQVRFVVILFVILALGAGGVLIALRPPQKEWPLFGVLLATPIAAAVLSSTIARRQGWWRKFGSLTVALVVTCILNAATILVTLTVTTQLMFTSAHDAGLAIVIVIFATCVTMAFSYFVASSLSQGLSDITDAAKQVKQGNFSARIEDRGNDEIAQLASEFNSMTARLQAVREHELRLDAMRRDLIAWVSHDLRTPLTSLRARVEALADGVVQEPAEVARYLSTIQNDTQSLSRLIDDLFELATIDAGGLKLELMPCDLNDLVSDTIETMSVIAARGGISLTGAAAPDVGIVRVSPPHIQRVLNNLVSNAIAHTPAGQVTVGAHRMADGRVCVEVTDTGEGIAAEDVPHVFDRFYRGDGARTRSGNAKGMGLGLAIARALVEAHGGHIELTSTLGRGTKVMFTLPG